MDRIPLVRTQPFPPLIAERSMSSRDKRAHEQFAREYADQILRTRAALLARSRPGLCHRGAHRTRSNRAAARRSLRRSRW